MHSDTLGSGYVNYASQITLMLMLMLMLMLTLTLTLMPALMCLT